MSLRDKRFRLKFDDVIPGLGNFYPEDHVAEIDRIKKKYGLRDFQQWPDEALAELRKWEESHES